MNTRPSHDPDLNLGFILETEDEGMSHTGPVGTIGKGNTKYNNKLADKILNMKPHYNTEKS